ncbi:hypothetical protein ACK32R_04665, partial [Aeromonas dhakensis]|uniref:hypothetical protein n=1 Tax=Aeromonas dhakensis TaxID=196024 RepID=UPI003986EF3E
MALPKKVKAIYEDGRVTGDMVILALGVIVSKMPEFLEIYKSIQEHDLKSSQADRIKIEILIPNGVRPDVIRSLAYLIDELKLSRKYTLVALAIVAGKMLQSVEGKINSNISRFKRLKSRVFELESNDSNLEYAIETVISEPISTRNHTKNNMARIQSPRALMTGSHAPSNALDQVAHTPAPVAVP